MLDDYFRRIGAMIHQTPLGFVYHSDQLEPAIHPQWAISMPANREAHPDWALR
jgi:hypothetical protein